jgi:hypothetical protein
MSTTAAMAKKRGRIGQRPRPGDHILRRGTTPMDGLETWREGETGGGAARETGEGTDWSTIRLHKPDLSACVEGRRELSSTKHKAETIARPSIYTRAEGLAAPHLTHAGPCFVSGVGPCKFDRRGGRCKDSPASASPLAQQKRFGNAHDA